MFDGFHREVDIEVRPVQMMCARELNVRDLSHGGITEPRKVLERHEQLTLADEEPEAVRRYVSHFHHARSEKFANCPAPNPAD